MGAEPPFVPFTTASLIGKYTTDNLPVLTFAAGGTVVGTSTTDTLTNKTLTAPTINGATIGSSIDSDYKRCSAQVDATSTNLANVTGLTGFTLVAGATYEFQLNLYGTAGGTGGWKVAFNYTTLTLTAINANALAFTASAVAASNTTTTTTQTSLIASNTAFTNAIITGTLVVNAAGTLDVQFAENSANSTSSIFVGSTAQFTRIA